MSKKKPETAPELEPNDLEPTQEEATIDPVQAACDEWQDRALRTQAEYENYRRRTRQERESLVTDVRADTIAALLPVYDNLLRAMQQPTQDAAYAKGVELILQQWNTLMESLNVAPIAVVGEPFDPNTCEAVAHVEDESVGANTIVEVFTQGFRIGEKILRHALVRVAN